ncbi:unnamed protein product [Rhizoctonia solani]|uniref:Carbonic anhydrase n=1 Tax=Rhizoctonia solani TaxID=456999 RepID=A0A8H3GYX4_9AGAM|nr:unnamed protein product [Rhizoctonia solani]
MRKIIETVRPDLPKSEEPGALADVEDSVARTGLYILRNAGGRAQEALRSIIVSQALLNTTDIHVIHHLGCGMAGHSEEGLRKELLDRIAPPLTDPVTRAAVTLQLAQHQFLPILADADEAVRVDVRFLRNHPLIRKDTKVKGWLYVDIHKPPNEHHLRSVDVPDA